MKLVEQNTTRKTLKTVLSFAAVGLLGVACGKSNSTPQLSQLKSTAKIIGGEVASNEDSFAHSTAALYDSKAKGLCTVTILSKNLLVTAAHCAQSPADALKIFFGIDPRSKDRQMRLVKSLIVNPGYAKTMQTLSDIEENAINEEKQNNSAFDPQNPRPELIKKIREQAAALTNWGDIALLKLDGEIPDGYTAAKLLSDKNIIQNGSTILLAGYGVTHPAAKMLAKQKSVSSMDVTFAGGDDDILLRKVEVRVKDRDFSPTEVLLDQTNGKGACHGDSGGPAYSIVDGQLYVWGVTSRGIQDPTDSCGVYSAYTDMLDHTEWILKSAGELGADI